MACHEIQNWTFCELVGAFLDLAILFLLLCGSTLAYLVTNFLGLFGLCLPCPCNGQFRNPSYTNCLLVDCPLRKIDSVQFKLRTRFPFDPILSNWSRVHEEASCSSCSTTTKKSRDVGGHRFGLRRRIKAAVGNRKFSVGSTRLSGLQSNATEVPQSPVSVTGGRIRVPVSSDDVNKASADGSLLQQVSSSETNTMEKDKCPKQLKFDFNGDPNKIVQFLEHELEEERTARSALHLELEKERNSAATAADEAMAMIMRLQEEKATIEMEKKQYRRMIEEKSVYDAEEMNILKEMLIMRDLEKHYLDKEVEVYRQMVYENQQMDAKIPSRSIEDQLSMLQYVSQCFSDKEMVKYADRSSQNEVSFDAINRTFAFGKELPIPVDEDKQQQSDGDQKNSVVGVDPCIHDVHVVDEECDTPYEVSRNLKLSRNANDNLANDPKNSSDITNLLSQVGGSRGKAVLADMRRNSMSAVDYERLRIDNEVGRLRERLKFVQRGREKLSSSVGCWETERAERKVSLHPSSPQVFAKNRPWRSVSLTVLRSS